MYLCTAFTEQRDVAQLVSVHVWGACGRWFESSHPDLRTKKKNGVMILHNNIVTFFCAKSQLPIGGRASPLDNTTQTIHNSEFIIFGGTSDGGKRMNGRLTIVVERDARPPICPQKS